MELVQILLGTGSFFYPYINFFKLIRNTIYFQKQLVIQCWWKSIVGPGPGCNDLNAYNLDLCCSKAEPCGQFEGKCKLDSECMGQLKCGTDNCVRSSNVDITSDSHFDCCYQGWSISDKVGTWLIR